MTFTPVCVAPPNFNVAPTHDVPVVRDHDGKREGVLMRWGLIPSWAKDKKIAQINARGDTVATKPMFRSAFKRRRCLVVADGYYEWLGTGAAKQPYYYSLTKDAPFVFAGLWEHWEHDGELIDSCAIITTDANELAAEVHDRMPVLLAPDAWEPAIDPPALQELLIPFPAKRMTACKVSPDVGSVKNNRPDLILPIP